MIIDKLTPNELAKLELYSKMEEAFFDGVNGHHLAGDKVTDVEEEEVYRHLNNKMVALRKQWGMDKIFAKAGWNRD